MPNVWVPWDSFPPKKTIFKELAKKVLNFGGEQQKKNLLLQLALFTSLIIFFLLHNTNFAQLKGTGLILIFYTYSCSYS